MRGEREGRKEWGIEEGIRRIEESWRFQVRFWFRRGGSGGIRGRFHFQACLSSPLTCPLSLPSNKKNNRMVRREEGEEWDGEMEWMEGIIKCRQGGEGIKALPMSPIIPNAMHAQCLSQINQREGKRGRGKGMVRGRGIIAAARRARRASF